MKATVPNTYRVLYQVLSCHSEERTIYQNSMVSIVDDVASVAEFQRLCSQFFHFVTSSDITTLKWLKWIAYELKL